MSAKTETLNVEGMSCGHCVKSVEDALKGIDGVQASEVEIGTVSVTYDTDRTSRQQIERVIEETGYEVPKAA